MALSVQRPKGTQDVVPAEVYKWHTAEQIVKDTAEQFGFREIRIPTFEETGLFVRSVGDTTDVVQKEMYTVSASGGSTFTLRPEGTAGTIRAVMENGLLNEGLPQKLFYILSCFRHEKPQAGRLREFHQFGCELIGAADPAADAELIALAKSVIDKAGLKNVVLNINSIGCPECRANYHKALKTYFSQYKDKLCATCQERLEKNPMRLLDCKSDEDKKIAEDAPVILDYLCSDCQEHFVGLQENLKLMGIDYKINPRIVRGLDYYTRTVFEFITTDIGAQGTVCGGGRYDGLIEALGGKPAPALGFGMGLERLILTMQKQGCEFLEPKTCDIYIAAMGKEAKEKAYKVISMLREEGYRAEYDLVGRGLKAQMKYADKIKARYVMVLGENEINTGSANVKNMKTGVQTQVSLDEGLLDDFGACYYDMLMEEDEMFRSFAENFGNSDREQQ
ncbi:histidine--tRNA ligase [Hominimerdicola sp. 21CYCFAH17_S]